MHLFNLCCPLDPAQYHRGKGKTQYNVEKRYPNSEPKRDWARLLKKESRIQSIRATGTGAFAASRTLRHRARPLPARQRGGMGYAEGRQLLLDLRASALRTGDCQAGCENEFFK